MMAHDERCKQCKETIRLMLEKLYGDVIPNYRFNIGTSPEDYQESTIYTTLSEIYGDLQNHRNHHEFVKARYVDVDYFIPNPGFILEFDESQHFTKPRKIALERYSDNHDFGFPVARWIQLCKDLDKHDNDPPFRDEQRAWYDTIRDFLPVIMNLQPTIRVYSRDMEWCTLDPDKLEDINRFKTLIEGKIRIKTTKKLIDFSNRFPRKDWIATVVLSSQIELEDEKNPKNNQQRIDEIKVILHTITNKISGDGVILFPGGWVHTGQDPAEKIYPEIEAVIKEILGNFENKIVVCIGIDGQFDRPFKEDPYDQDQMALSIDKTGIIAIARKFFPTNKDEASHIILSTNYLEGEAGKSRTFEISGIRYYPFVCYDVYGPDSNPEKYPNPGVHVGLNLIHRFHPKGQGLSQENFFPRFGWSESSYHWNIPVFGTVIFYRRDIPSAWPTGIFWKLGEVWRNSKYEEIALNPDLPVYKISLPEGYAEIRIFTDIGKKIKELNTSFPVVPSSKPKKSKQLKFESSQGRDIFNRIILDFQNSDNTIAELRRELIRKDQCRFSFPQWPRINDIPKKYVCYEFNDWIYTGKSEITVEILFGLNTFKEIGEIIHNQTDAITKNLPYPAHVLWDTKSTKGWHRLKFIFPDDVDSKLIAKSMNILIQETKDTINNWLKLKNMNHY